MSEKILVPTLGESVSEATVSKWLKKKRRQSTSR
jgi:pyruvate/2-oxoglutarate dehydrogenase complex dihydrolipoamide acyltransferase (E2) component